MNIARSIKNSIALVAIFTSLFIAGCSSQQQVQVRQPKQQNNQEEAKESRIYLVPCLHGDIRTDDGLRWKLSDVPPNTDTPECTELTRSINSLANHGNTTMVAPISWEDRGRQ